MSKERTEIDCNVKIVFERSTVQAKYSILSDTIVSDELNALIRKQYPVNQAGEIVVPDIFDIDQEAFDIAIDMKVPNYVVVDGSPDSNGQMVVISDEYCVYDNTMFCLVCKTKSVKGKLYKITSVSNIPNDYIYSNDII